MLATTLEPLDVARVAPRLWIGSAPSVGPTVSRAHFDVLMLCAIEYQPRSWEIPGVRVVHAGFEDTPFPSEDEQSVMRNAAFLTARAISLDKRVLVTCWQGRNRSGLVCALALRQLHRWHPEICVEAVRAARPGALTNPTFCRLVESL